MGAGEKRENMAKVHRLAPGDVPTARAMTVRAGARERIAPTARVMIVPAGAKERIAPTVRATIARVRARERIAPTVRETIAHARERDIVAPKETRIADMGSGVGMVSIIQAGRGWRAVMKSALKKWPG